MSASTCPLYLPRQAKRLHTKYSLMFPGCQREPLAEESYYLGMTGATLHCLVGTRLPLSSTLYEVAKLIFLTPDDHCWTQGVPIPNAVSTKYHAILYTYLHYTLIPVRLADVHRYLLSFLPYRSIKPLCVYIHTYNQRRSPCFHPSQSNLVHQLDDGLRDSTPSTTSKRATSYRT